VADIEPIDMQVSPLHCWQARSHPHGPSSQALAAVPMMTPSMNSSSDSVILSITYWILVAIAIDGINHRLLLGSTVGFC
jgi:hypothetical protein